MTAPAGVPEDAVTGMAVDVGVAAQDGAVTGMAVDVGGLGSADG
jgi:hypothetical protein